MHNHNHDNPFQVMCFHLIYNIGLDLIKKSNFLVLLSKTGYTCKLVGKRITQDGSRRIEEKMNIAPIYLNI